VVTSRLEPSQSELRPVTLFQGASEGVTLCLERKERADLLPALIYFMYRKIKQRGTKIDVSKMQNNWSFLALFSLLVNFDT
jgi:hypothetical protein